MKKEISYIEEEYKFQKKEDVVQRIFWVIMFLLMFYALLGGLGDNGGVLSKGTHAFEAGSLEFQNYMRVEKSFEMRLFKMPEAEKRELIVGLNNDYLSKIRIVDIDPEPSRVSVSGNQVLYTFPMEGNAQILFLFDPLKKGQVRLEVSVNQEKFSTSQFIFF